MDEQQKPLPENIKNSIYVHPFVNDTDEIPKACIGILPLNHTFLRLSSTHAHLTLITKPQNPEPKFTKCKIVVISETVDNTLYTAIYLKSDGPNAVFPSLGQFTKNKNFLLNLVHHLENDEKMLGEEITTREIIAQINQHNLFNNNDFYDTYINKKDKIIYSNISKIKPLTGKICLLVFVDNTMALISKKQLFAAMAYIQKIKSEASESLSQMPMFSQLVSQTLFPLPDCKSGTSSEKSDSDSDPEFASRSQRNILEEKPKPKNDLASQSGNQSFHSSSKRKAKDDPNPKPTQLRKVEEDKPPENNDCSQKP